MAQPKPLLTKKRLLQIEQTVQESWQAQQHGLLAHAEAGYRAVLALKPNHFDALHMLALICFDRGDNAQALQCIVSALKTRPDYPDALSNHGMILHALGRSAEALENFDRALKFKPDTAEVHANRGNALLRLGRLADALAAYDRAIALQPRFALAIYNRGNVLQALGRPADALGAYDAALALSPNWLEAINNRGNALLHLDRAADALAAYDAALALHPGQPEAANNKGNALNALGRPSEALACFDLALAANPHFAGAHYHAAMTRLTLGDFTRGWEQYEWRWHTAQFQGQGRRFQAPLWLGREPLVGKTILLHAEQGFGDMIQFARYAALVAAQGAHVILEMPQPLMPLMQRLAGVTTLVERGAALPPFDFHCPLMSLPHALGTTPESVPAQVPYLAASPDRIARFTPALAPLTGARIGLVWSGRPTHHNDRNRSLTLAQLAPLFESGASFVSLQRDLRASDTADLQRWPILHLGEQLADFADTAAAIAQLDLVISADTSAAHLAGALNKPVWIMVPYAPDFRWLLGRQDSPWYPSMRLYRQPQAGDWASVVTAMAADVAKLKLQT